MTARRTLPAALVLAFALALLSGCGGDATGTGASSSPEPAAGAFDGDRAYADVERMVALGPRPSGSEANAEQARLLASELERAGVDHVSVGDDSGLANVTGVIPGKGPGFVVVAAHHDTKDIAGFVGANDGASGAAVVLELARSLPNPLPGPSIALALFDGEEARGDRDFEVDGTRGSRLYVKQAKAGGDPAAGIPPLDEVEAMVLFDMVGDCDLQIPREFSSDERLYGAFAEAAGGAPFEGASGPILDDHVPFLEAGVPAVDLIDFTYGGDEQPGALWHTTGDTLEQVCPSSLDAVGEAAVEALPQLP